MLLTLRNTPGSWSDLGILPGRVGQAQLEGARLILIKYTLY